MWGANITPTRLLAAACTNTSSSPTTLIGSQSSLLWSKLTAYCKDTGSPQLAARSLFQDEAGEVKVAGRYMWNQLGHEPFGGLSQLQGYANHMHFRGLSQGIKCRELEMCPRPKTAGILTKVCPLRQTFEPCDHGFGHYVTHKC